MPLLSWLPVIMLLPASAIPLSTPSVNLWQMPVFLLLLALLSVSLLVLLSQLVKKQQQIEQQQQALNYTLEQTPGLVAIFDAELQLVRTSQSLQQLLNHHGAKGTQIPWYQDSACLQHAGPLLREQLQQQVSWQGSLWLGTAQHTAALIVSINRIDYQATKQYLLVGHDMTEQWQSQQLQHNLLSRDPLTGLPNASIFDEQLKYAIASCNDSNPQLAVLFIKLSFTLAEQAIQPSFDHTELIATTGQRIRQLTPAQMLVARFSDDSFMILVPPHLCKEDCNIALNRLAHKIVFGATEQASQPSALRVHIGLSIYPIDAGDHNSLCSSAIKAAQLAEKTGKNSIQFANTRYQQLAPEFLLLETELYRSAAQGEFDVYFQPQISISSNRVVGYEALLRWHSPKRGVLLPAIFLSLADETGLIVSLDRIVFKKVCEQVKYWQQTGLNRGRVAINISTLQFQQADFIAFLQQQLQRHELSASLFELELSEDIFRQPADSVQQKLQQLNQLGFGLTLDRFGEGISSLNHLRNFPLHSLKIAPGLARDMEHNEQQRNITASLIRLAGYLQLEVIACGVETEMQAYLLHVMGCDKLQGHLFSKALPASEVPALLAKENKLFKKAVS
ncbi:putative bifunctional diguanylate cyclase/phosphodiesterase [Arsukibacterium sp.]|uniref:putative bifunctional diguanylate cyclase/phosphodiesterase n=1 Tax=Arsukibacterium sp. TaxID=1977258 RepID=UPI002FDA80CC